MAGGRDLIRRKLDGQRANFARLDGRDLRTIHMVCSGSKVRMSSSPLVAQSNVFPTVTTGCTTGPRPFPRPLPSF